MSAFICRSCRASRYAVRWNGCFSLRTYSSQLPPQEAQEAQEATSSMKPKDQNPPTGIESRPNNPQPSRNFDLHSPVSEELKIKPEQLHHLLRLSALPMPKSPEEEDRMLNALALQLAFVEGMRKVDADGVEPLQSIRDETREGREEATIGLETLKDALAKEDIKGRSRRPRRRRELVNTKGVEDWDVLGTASDKLETPMGKYFVVRSGKGGERGNE